MSGQPATRRVFLQILGRIAGSGAVLRAMTAMGITAGATACGSASGSDAPASSAADTVSPPNSGAGPDVNVTPVPADWPAGAGVGKHVIILGAGIAGMAAAWELRKLGYECTILEAQSSAGGRCRTLRGGDVVEELDATQFCDFEDDPGLYFNAGPARIPHHHEFILGYCRQFAVALEMFSNDNRAARLHSRAAFGGEPQLARRVLADTRGHIASLLASAVDQGALDQDLSLVDRDALRAMLVEFGDLRASGAYSGSSRAGFVGQENAGDPARDAALPVLALEALLDSDFWRTQLDYSQSLDQQPVMLQPVGGMDRIARAFETRVAEDLAFEAAVTDIRNTAAGVDVSYQQAGQAHSLSADYCICTIPATVLRSISNNFSAAHRAAIDGFRYSRACKIAFQSRRFWEQDHNIYGGISWTDQRVTQLWYPSAGLGSDQGVVLGAYTFGDANGDWFASLSPGQRLDECARQADRVHPGFSAEARHGISVCWPNMPGQLGAWGVSDPGILREADGQVHFAGEHLSDLQGWQEGAVRSAYSAIDAIVRRDA